jgi:PEGA domain
MFDDQTTSRWIPRNQLGLPISDYSQTVRTEGWGQAVPPEQPLQSFDATPAIAFEIGWDDEEFAERRPQAQEQLPPQNTQPATRQMRAALLPAVSSQWDLAADIARIRARPRVPLWLRALMPGVALFAAVLFGVVIVFVEPSSAKPAAPPVSIPVSAPTPAPVLADSADANPAPAQVAKPPAESRQSVRHVAASHEAGSDPAATSEAPSAKAKHTEANTAARVVAGEPAPAAVGGGHLGMLRLNSRPWSKVFVDGRLLGNTPIMGVPLTAGEHRVELVNEALDVRKTIQVTIKPDNVVTKIVLLVD